MSHVVSVLLIPYNHEKYIAESIDSVLIKKTNFDFEIVIGEDIERIYEKTYQFSSINFTGLQRIKCNQSGIKIECIFA